MAWTCCPGSRPACRPDCVQREGWPCCHPRWANPCPGAVTFRAQPPSLASAPGLRQRKGIGESTAGSWLSEPASGPLHLVLLPAFTQSLSLCRDTSLEPQLPASHQLSLLKRQLCCCPPPSTLPPKVSPSSFQLGCCSAFTVDCGPPAQDPGACLLLASRSSATRTVSANQDGLHKYLLEEWGVCVLRVKRRSRRSPWRQASPGPMV